MIAIGVNGPSKNEQFRLICTQTNQTPPQIDMYSYAKKGKTDNNASMYPLDQESHNNTWSRLFVEYNQGINKVNNTANIDAYHYYPPFITVSLSETSTDLSQPTQSPRH